IFTVRQHLIFRTFDIHLEKIHRLSQIVPQAHARNFVLFPGMRVLPCECFGEAAAANSIRKENLFFAVAAQRGLYPTDIFQVVAGDIALQKWNNVRVRFKSDDSRSRISLFEIKNRHPDITAAIQDQRVGAHGIKMVDPMNENILVENIKIGAVIEPDGVPFKAERGTRLKRVYLTPHSGQMRSLAQTPAGSNEVAKTRHRSEAARAQPAAKGGCGRVQQTPPSVGCSCDRATFAAVRRAQRMRARLRARDNSSPPRCILRGCGRLPLLCLARTFPEDFPSNRSVARRPYRSLQKDAGC